MTRNRDDFSALQALRAAALGCLVIGGSMAGLGTVMAGQKEAALDRATAVAASAIRFEATASEVAAVDAGTRKS